MTGPAEIAPGWWATFWVDGVLVPVAARFPSVMRRLAAPGAVFAWWTSTRLRRVLHANARRISGPDTDARTRRAYGRAVIRNHYQFIIDVASSRDASLAKLGEQIEVTTGVEHFHEARARSNGIIVVTAHLGSFEVGVAALRREADSVHVVFKRDPFKAFEAARQHLHTLLGVEEVPIDDGLESWLRLRNALARDEVVLIQADRAMPGQRSADVPFLGGTLRLPLGPFRLAEMTNATVLPVFAPRMPSGGVKLEIAPPIIVAPGRALDGVTTFAAVVEECVRRYGDQWLCMHPICLEDGPNGDDPDEPRRRGMQ